jgi:hypothetical protein
MVNGSIYRDMEMEHITQKFMEEYVDININEDNIFETEVDFETITELANLVEEDDDDPEIS